MMARRSAGGGFIRAGALVAALVLAHGCGPFGRVEQGIVVASDGETLTLVLDSNPHGAPVYNRMPPVKVQIPSDPKQMGPAPVAGRLIRLDVAAGEAILYSPEQDKLVSVGFELIRRTGGLFPDDERVVRSGAPRVEAAARTVTLYARRSRELVTIRVPKRYLSLPANAWRSGDVVRYYFKDPRQALRMMNVTKTRIG